MKTDRYAKPFAKFDPFHSITLNAWIDLDFQVLIGFAITILIISVGMV